MDEISGKWYLETLFPDCVMMLRVRQVLYSGKTQYQNVEILESEVFGRSLVLDGKTQSTEKDEHIYHEGLVHPAMLMHPHPRTIFIGGGGEGGTLREVLSHKSVERVVMVDLDREVVELCRHYLPQHHRGSFDDPRVELLHQDARSYLENCPRQFDVMVMDLVDPLDGGTAFLLYTDQYYRIARLKLNPGGVLVTQSGPAGLLAHQECFTTIHNTLQGVFANVRGCQVHIPAFQTLWGFNIASDAQLNNLDVPDELDALVARRLNRPLRFYDGESHTNMFSLPRFIRQSIQQERRVNRDEAPVFMA
jgi:spermidine synthase